jgi:hypothetical protein
MKDVKLQTTEDITEKVRNNERARMQDKLDEVNNSLEYVPALIRYKKELLEIDKEAQLIQLKKYTKLNYDFEYEKDKKFHELMLRKQALLNQIHNLNAELEIDKLRKTLEQLKEQRVYYESVLDNKGDGNE